MTNKYDMPIRVFLSSSPEDESWRIQLKTSLAGLKNSISLWDDREVNAGHEREKMIRKNLHKADIILLLISPHFSASDDCADVVLLAMNRHRVAGIHVIPIILHPCKYDDAPFC